MIKKILGYWSSLCTELYKEREQKNTYKYINALLCLCGIIFCFGVFALLNTIPCNEYIINFAYVPTEEDVSFKLNQKFLINNIDGQLIKGGGFMHWSIENPEENNCINYQPELRKKLQQLRKEVLANKPISYDTHFGDCSADLTVKAIGYSSVSNINTNINWGERLFNYITHQFVCWGRILHLNKEGESVEEFGGYKVVLNPSLSLYESQNGAIFYSFFSSSCFKNWPIIKGITPKTFWFSPFDISQSYYKIRFNEKLFTDYIDVLDSTSTLTIEFKTMVDLSPIVPQPDELGSNYIKYTDITRIKQVYSKGIEFHAKYPEMANIQSIRLFALTTMLVFIMNSLLAFVVLYLKRDKRDRNIS